MSIFKKDKNVPSIEDARNAMNNEGPLPINQDSIVTYQQSHTLPDLPYSYSALEPFMSQQTLYIHHRKHHGGYVERLNKLIADTPLAGRSLEDIILEANGRTFDFAAQCWNHAFFWKCLTPSSVSPNGELGDALRRDFGSIDLFKKNFEEAAARTFGSSWVWLVQEPITGKLSILTTRDGDNPITHLKKPLLTCDLWEHAYYLDHQNEMGAFVKNFIQLIDWNFVKTNLFVKAYPSMTNRVA